MNRTSVGASSAATATANLGTFSDDGLSEFLCARPRLFRIAYRILGSLADAEDVVQDVWVRWQTTDRRRVRNALAFLATAVRRLAINVRQSAHARRETCADSRLLELVDAGPDPSLKAERAEALDCAVLRLLETLLPTERAAFVLREAFNHPYREIAHLLRIEEANARQLVTRAREHVSGGRHAPVTPAEQARLRDAFVSAARTGALATLERLFASTPFQCPSQTKEDSRPRRTSRAHTSRSDVTTHLPLRSMTHKTRDVPARRSRPDIETAMTRRRA